MSCFFPIILNVRTPTRLEVKKTDYSGGKAHFIRKKKHNQNEVYIQTDICDVGSDSPRDIVAYAKTYLEKRREQTTSEEYLIVHYEDGQYEMFSDENGNEVEYARGYTESIEPMWNHSKDKMYAIKIHFQVAWS